MNVGGSRLRDFLAELRRRHVFRIAVAYAVVAFVVLQVADIAFPALALPDWTLTLVVLAAILGFPLALVLAWIFDFTREGVRRTAPLDESPGALKSANRTIAVASAVVILLVSIVAGWLVASRGRPWGVGSGDRPRIMIVVLPFENLGREADAYFAEGITEEITARLAGIEGLGVIARTSAVQFRGASKSIKEIGEALGVEYVLEGTVRWERREAGPDQVRVTPQLIRVADETHVWANSYEEPLASVFDVQTSIAQDVTSALNLRLLEPERIALRSRSTENIEAYEYFQRGNKYAESAATSLGAREAAEMYRRALELDPEFEEAARALSRTESDLYWAGRAEEMRSLGQDPTDRLDRLSLWEFAGDTVAYHLARASVLDATGDDVAADAQYDSARVILERQLAAGQATAGGYARLGLALAGLGESERAVHQGRAAMDLVPEDGEARDAWAANLAHIYAMLGEEDRAIDLLLSLVAGETRLTVPLLLADPAWASLREHERFEELAGSWSG